MMRPILDPVQHTENRPRGQEGSNVNATTYRALTVEERDGLTCWGDTFSAQVRDTVDMEGNEAPVLVIHHYADAPRSTEDGHPWELPQHDAEKLRELLNEAAERGVIAHYAR